MEVERTVRSEETANAPGVARFDADGEEGDRTVGRHLALGAIGEDEVAGEHAGDEVADDDPGDELDDEAGGTFGADRFGEQPAEAGAENTAEDTPEDDDDQDTPEEAAFALSRFWEDIVLEAERCRGYAGFAQGNRRGFSFGGRAEGDADFNCARL